MHPVTRDSARLTLRELSPDDVDDVLAIYGSTKATEHLSFPPRSREEVAGIVSRSIASATARPREEYALAVTRRDSADLIGFARLAIDPHQQRAATIGAALRPEAWGVGYGRETLSLLFGLAFADLDLHRVWAARSPLNTAAEKMMLAAGMVEEGRIRGHVHTRGAWRDSIVYGILRDEWQG
ncbi:GNAT family N-acetyltransferase [Streptomyces sp. SAJ15]|uniref:GNAT family N-acetyltransferase n=1 Tax=Streptomyces sp. SAJ15 TaxID=2011095 RepID=UPI001186458E|nr:GNAT family protein [Streptomyces sp. SAJ15]TVL91744.1 GNAT family N-acetyltransferase [Streptomyces sp. SAJ15]